MFVRVWERGGGEDMDRDIERERESIDRDIERTIIAQSHDMVRVKA